MALSGSGNGGANLWGRIVDTAHPLADGLVAAWLPTSSGYWDACSEQFHAAKAKGSPKLISKNEGHGLGYGFTTSDAYTAEKVLPVMVDGLSVALWVNFASSPTAYGSHIARAGTVGATHAGGDWDIAAYGTSTQLAFTRSGAILALSSFPVSSGAWYLWHFSMSAAGAYNWWLSGNDIGTLDRGNGTGAGFRTATGVTNINGSGTTAAGSSNSAIGAAYIWHRQTTADEASMLFLEERRLLKQRRIWVPVGAGGSSATVTPAIIASTATFGAATVARTAVAAVTTTRIESTATFGTHTVSAASVAAVTATRIASTATTGSHTVARTALAAVTASRIESTASIGAHVVSAAGVAAVTATRIASTATFGTATVARTAVAAVSPTRIASTATFGSHAVAAAGMGAVSASRIASTVSFGAATVTRTAVHSVQPGRIDSSVAFGVPSVTSSTPQIVVGRIASTAAVYAPVFVRTGPVVAASEYRRFASPFATLRQAGSAITQTVTLASAIDLE